MSAAIATQLASGRLNAVLAGRHGSGAVPYGYARPERTDWRDRRMPLLEPHPFEAEIVRLIFRLYNRRGSLQRVVESLTAAGYRTRRGKTWSRAGLAWILRNRVYIGQVHHRDRLAHGLHKPIVAPIVFFKAGQRLKRNDKQRPQKERRAAQFAARMDSIGGAS